MSRRRPPTVTDASRQYHQAAEAVRYLRTALICARYAKTPRTQARIRLALSSALGAVRHAEHRLIRAEHIARQEP